MRDVADTVRAGRRADRGQSAGRPGAVSGGALQIGAQPRLWDAVFMDAEPVSRLHPRLSLLLRPPLPQAVRDERRDEFASVILVKTNIVEVLRRELARPSWERRAGRHRLGDRRLSAHRGTLQTDARRAGGAARASQSGERRHQGPDDRPRQGGAGPACRAFEGSSGVHQRAMRGRRRVRGARARDGPSAGSACGPTRELSDAGVQVRNPDEPNRARGSRREPSLIERTIEGAVPVTEARRGRQRDAPRGRRPHTFLSWLERSSIRSSWSGYRGLYRGKSAPAA